MTMPMFGPRTNNGGRPGQPVRADFVERMQAELYAARGTSTDDPLLFQTGPAGTQLGLQRVTLDLRRFVLTADLPVGGSADANILIYDNDTLQWTIEGESFTVYDSLSARVDGSVLLREGQFGFAKFFTDNGLWEVVQIGDLITDDFFPARLVSHTGTTPILYSWVESEWTSATASATDKSGGRSGDFGPDSWLATELNNRSVANDTIVWMRRGYKPTSPADATITKTLAGNNAGTHAAFSLYVDGNTTSGGSYTITMDSFTTATIAKNASGATTKSAIETATGYTLSAFSGSGTLASPWTFTVTSDTRDHTASTNISGLKDKSGFRFDASSASSAGLCGWGAMPAASGTYKVVVKQDSDDCLAYVDVTECASPVDINGGLTA